MSHHGNKEETKHRKAYTEEKATDDKVPCSRVVIVDEKHNRNAHQPQLHPAEKSHTQIFCFAEFVAYISCADCLVSRKEQSTKVENPNETIEDKPNGAILSMFCGAGTIGLP